MKAVASLVILLTHRPPRTEDLDMAVDDLIRDAMIALNSGDPRKARDQLAQAMEEAGDTRADLLQAMAVVLLQLGEPVQARRLMEQAAELAWSSGAPPEFLREVYLGIAAACEDADEPAAAELAYHQADEVDPGHPKVRSGRANLLLSLGRIPEALEQLDALVAEDRDADEYVEAAAALAQSVRAFLADPERTPRDLLVAHRDSYVDFFDETAAEQEAQGWVAECARMRRAPDGSLVPILPDGARPYAAIRVDLVNFGTGEAGQIGDQPMVVAVHGYEPLARAVILFEGGELPFSLLVSSQCPWDQLPIQILLERGDAEAVVDPVIGDWYSSGFNGRFGTREGGRFHYISDPQPCRGGRGLTYDVDLGRANLLAIEDLIARLVDLHAHHPLQQVILGRGHLTEPLPAEPPAPRALLN